MAKRGRALVSARALVIELVDGDELVVAAAAGEVGRDLLGRRLALEETVAHAALRGLRTQHIDDELNRLRFERHGLGQLGFTARTGLARAARVPRAAPTACSSRSIASTATRRRSRPRTSACSRPSPPARPPRLATAQSAAAERQRQRLAATEHERGRWARELHDETLQGLAALRLR